MIHFHRLHHIHKSNIITIINFFECIAAGIFYVVFPLLLFELFKSELIVSQIASASAATSFVATLFFGVLLKKFSRSNMHGGAIILYLVSIALLLFIPSLIEAYSARIIFAIAIIITPAILSLYLRDLSTLQELPKKEGVYRAFLNLAWVIGPMSGGFLLSFGKEHINIISESKIFHGIPSELIPYTFALFISLVAYITSQLIFHYGKFISKHPHLQEKNDSRAHKIHLHAITDNIKEYFQNIKRAYSFLNSSFINIWWCYVFTFWAILFTQKNMSNTDIGILIGFVCLPMVFTNLFSHKIIAAIGSSRALIWGYILFFIGLLIAQFGFGLDHVYAYAITLIISQFALGIPDSLIELQYFEGTDKSNEEKFYTTHMLGRQISAVVSPLFIGGIISIWSIETAFNIYPYLFIPFFIILFFMRKSELKMTES